MIRFENPLFLYLLLLIPALIAVYWLRRRWIEKARLSYSSVELIGQMMPRFSKRKPLVKFILYTTAFGLLVVGLANPQMGTKLEEVKREGVDILIALDVSNSMKAEDLKPNRLDRAKRAIEKLVDNMKSDRIGIVVFAGEAFIQLPITSDYSAAKLYAGSIGTDVIQTQGTALASAIETCIEALDSDDSKNRAIIIISDGENHEEDPIIKANEAFEKGIVVHTIGMGSVQGAPIPIYRNGKQVGFKQDNGGNTVVSRLNEEMLQNIAQSGNGIYVRATNNSTGLQSIFNEINKLEKTEYEAKQYTDFEDRFQPFVGLVLLILFFEFLISTKKSKWIEKLTLFND
ncbi:MAG: VWA domain-containing protein [Vicingaceae bacterium]